MMDKKQGGKGRLHKGKWLLGAALAALSVGAMAQQKTLYVGMNGGDMERAFTQYVFPDFEKANNIKMTFNFVPWPNFTDRMQNELNSKGKLCDLIIGDSQWIGGAAENGQYVKLNDFFKKEGISMDDYMPATVVGY